MKQLTLGSLFDGIGGFCYAAGIPSGIDTGCTIKPLWAAEVEPNCIDITRYRFNLEPCLKKSQTPIFQCLQVANGQPQEWLEGERLTPLGESLMLNIGEYPSVENESTLSEILEDNVPEKYYLSPKACLGILRRAKNKGRKLPDNLRIALEQKVAEGGEVLGLDFAHADSVVRTYKDITPTLVQNMGRGGGQTPCIMYEQRTIAIDQGGGKSQCGITTELSPTLTCTHGGEPVIYSEKRNVIPLRDEVTRNKASNGLGVGKVGGPCPTLTTADIHSVFYEAYQHHGYRESDTSGTLTAGQNNTVRGDTPLIVTDKKAFEENQHGGYRETQINGTLRAAGGSYGGGSETLITESTKTKGNIPSPPKKSIKDLLKKATQKVVYIIRRLTPVEGERLQGYPDDWTKYGADGNIIADTARYRAIGNSICVYCAERLYIGIIRILQEEEKDNERKDESLL